MLVFCRYTGAFDDIARLNDQLADVNRAKGLDVRIHVDGASGAFVAPFLYPDLKVGAPHPIHSHPIHSLAASPLSRKPGRMRKRSCQMTGDIYIYPNGGREFFVSRVNSASRSTTASVGQVYA